MPLIIVAGRPCTGKTYFANELMKFLQNKGSKVELFNEETLNISKNEGYKSSAKEKDVRGALKSSVDHNLTPEKFVIIDSLNYIKGYRYELYCTARTVRTTHCVVWVACEESKSKEINIQRISEGVDTYDPTM
jgi:protein KTI12